MARSMEDWVRLLIGLIETNHCAVVSVDNRYRILLRGSLALEIPREDACYLRIMDIQTGVFTCFEVRAAVVTALADSCLQWTLRQSQKLRDRFICTMGIKLQNWSNSPPAREKATKKLAEWHTEACSSVGNPTKTRITQSGCLSSLLQYKEFPEVWPPTEEPEGKAQE